jgi:hypothetical protein
MRSGALMPVFAPSRLLTGGTAIVTGQTIIAHGGMVAR